MRDDEQLLPTTHVPEPFRDVMERLCRVTVALQRLIARGEIADDLAAGVGVNADGDGQKALDIVADRLFLEALDGSDVAYYASEEQDDVVTLASGRRYALAIDPLDGSSNIDVDVSIGTIFSIYPSAGDPLGSFLRPVGEQVAAGYVIYGPQTSLVVTFGAGVQKYVFDPDTGRFVLTNPALQVPMEAREYAINASNYRHWPSPIRAFVDDLVAGAEGPRGQDFNMRWIASLVAEAHRILTRGGVFLYPADDRRGYERGRLRLLYECGPIAMLAREAGGDATDGMEPILSRRVATLHERTPLVFGSRAKVTRVTAYHDLSESERSALFGRRGLFRM